MPNYTLRGVYRLAADRQATPGCDKLLHIVFSSNNDEEACEWVHTFMEKRPEVRNLRLSDVDGISVPVEVNETTL